MKYLIGQKVHTYVGWGVVEEANYYGTGGIWYIVRFPNGMISNFPENQLSLD